MVLQLPGNVTPRDEKAEAQERASGLTQGDQQTLPELHWKSWSTRQELLLGPTMLRLRLNTLIQFFMVFISDSTQNVEERAQVFLIWYIP